MARPLKQGLDYYPMDCDFLNNLKVRKILRANGSGAIAILIDLLGNIYKDEGYYMQWDDEICFLVADKIGTSEASVSEIVKKALQVDFFNQNKFDDYKILTSKGIQDRYIEATRRRTEVILYGEYLLLSNFEPSENIKIISEKDENIVFDNNNLVSAYNNSINDVDNEQSKVKESKVNKSKVENLTYIHAVEDGLYLLPLQDGGIFPVTEDYILYLQDTFTELDLHKEILLIGKWFKDNPNKLRDEFSIKQFIENWLKQASNFLKNQRQESKNR